jgi:hypothetical protein
MPFPNLYWCNKVLANKRKCSLLVRKLSLLPDFQQESLTFSHLMGLAKATQKQHFQTCKATP